MTAGNILHMFRTKDVLCVQGLIETDAKTGWLWVFCGLFILGVPPSPMFFSKFLIIKQLFIDKHFILAGLFLLLITVVAYGIIRVVIKMSFSPILKDRTKSSTKLTIRNYLPQMVLLLIVLILGFYIPNWLYQLIEGAAKCI